MEETKSNQKNNVQKVKFPKDFDYEGLNRCGSLTKHNHIVRFLRVSLPSIAVTSIAFLLIWPQLTEQKEMFSVGFSNPLITEKTDSLSITNSKFFSTDRKNQPFMMTSRLALEAKPGSHIINLTEPKADVLLESGIWTVLTSKEGVFDQKKNTILLQKDVSLYTDAGYEFHTEKINIDLDSNSLSGNSPVSALFPGGEIKSGGISAKDGGDIIIFTGKAKLKYTPRGEEQAKEGNE